MKSLHKHALRILIAAALIAAVGGAIGIFAPKSIANSARFTGDTIRVKNFFGNSKLDPELDCTKVFEVEREVPKTEAMVKSSLQALLEGPTFPEAQKGFFSSLNPNIKINSFSIQSGVARVDFSHELITGVEGTCRLAAIHAEIEKTLMQFSLVKSVVITVEGKKDAI